MKKGLCVIALSLLSGNVFAAGTTTSAHQGFNWESILLLVVFIAIFYFLMIRPQMKRSKEHRNLMSNLDKGDEVVTNGGILGKIARVGDQFIELEIADKVIMKVQKQAVTNVLPKGSVKAD